ncbi:MAG: DUF3800 domain-containing protein [Sphingomicrobium sp.]
MADIYLFSDEAGCFTFNREPNVSRYFIICTVTVTSLDMALAITKFRHELIREHQPVKDYFHATTEEAFVRHRVYEEMLKHDFKFQVTICEKSKAMPQVTASKARFYQYPWYFHFKHAIAPHLKQDDRLVVTAASIGTKKERLTYTTALEDVVRQSAREVPWIVDFRPCQADPMLQVADYCAWAVQRKIERNDSSAYDQIKCRKTYEYDLWQKGTKHYY